MSWFYMFIRVGFIFTLEIGGLWTFGREKPMVKVASIQNLVMSSLAILKMVGGMATSSVLPLMEQGVCPCLLELHEHLTINQFWFSVLH